MLLAFFTFFVFTFALSLRTRGFGKQIWIALIVSVVAFSLLCAYTSVQSVWVPSPWSDDVFRQQNALGESQGTLPWSKLSYPIFLGVYHTPFNQLTYQGDYAYGQARFTTFLANASVLQVNGNFSYFYPIHGPSHLNYKIDFIFADSEGFFSFSVVLYALFNIIGALFGVILARILYKKTRKGQ